MFTCCPSVLCSNIACTAMPPAATPVHADTTIKKYMLRSALLPRAFLEASGYS